MNNEIYVIAIPIFLIVLIVVGLLNYNSRFTEEVHKEPFSFLKADIESYEYKMLKRQINMYRFDLEVVKEDIETE